MLITRIWNRGFEANKIDNLYGHVLDYDTII